MKLYKFRPLANCKDLERIKDIFENGFYCCDFLSFNDMNEGVFSINTKNKKITLGAKQEYKICSFSGKNALNSQLMWGHYANAGMGVAIEVEVNSRSDIEQVTYTNSFSQLNSIKEILTHKSKEWSYEHEFRHLSNIKPEKVKIGKITKIYFGTPYETLENYLKDIKNKHLKLKEYSKYKQKLKKYLERKHKLDGFCEEKKHGQK